MHLLSLADEHKKTARCHHAASAVVVVVIADPYFRLSLPVAAAATIIIENVVPVAHHDDIAASLCLRASSSFKHNASFVARLPTIRRHKSQSLHSPGNAKPPSGSGRSGRCPRVTDINASSENLEHTHNV
ncbi:conserved hypothetical protein [Culex quinquefasciatus]|uniref:Uncharacterized protein n=1 Tax=Culex quinquefasciatus TaxID=7176 RepID=B0WCL3_CULQU|nr:conserved hypothetical protein [Culex quinquefasciatus]|eukprot:XP_001846447.1 conserved hypothetical protein [Culex quinquefasciatus]